MEVQAHGLDQHAGSETNGFASTCGNTDHPDIQFALLPSIVDNHTRRQHLGHGFTLHTTLMRPKSRGSVTLQSADPHQPPKIDPGFSATPTTWPCPSRARNWF